MTPEELYLDLLKGVLTRCVGGESYRAASPHGKLKSRLVGATRSLFRPLGLELVQPNTFDLALRAEGRDRPFDAETMIGLKRLDNLQDCVVEVLRSGTPGDLIETGAWRGGAAIFMRAVLKAYGDTERTVWVADSFRGLPRPDPERYPRDKGDRHWQRDELAVSLDAVKTNFGRYGLLDEQVRFLPGWFSDSLPNAPIERLSILRLDGDMYESTIVALRSLYPKVSSGGFVIVDDYGAVPACKAAVDDWRAEIGCQEPMTRIDWTGVFWRIDAQ